MAMVNAAFDVLKAGPQPARPSSGRSGADYADDNMYRHYRQQKQSRQKEDPRARSPETPEWAWAGYSGGMPDQAHIYRNNYTDVNFIKKTMWEMSGKSKTEFTIWGYDGAYFRGVTTVFGSPKIFDEMAKAMIMWQTKGGNPYSCRAVFVNKKNSKDMYLVYADGTFYGNNPIKLTHKAFNANPGNDRRFLEQLPGFLDNLKAQGGAAPSGP
jgi:hypothetical protein